MQGEIPRAQLYDMAERFRPVRTYPQFQMLSDLMGFSDEVPKELVYVIFKHAWQDARKDSEAIGFFDAFYEALLHSTMLNKAVTTRTFFNLVGSLISWCYRSKDKTLYFKLVKIMSYVATRLMGA